VRKVFSASPLPLCFLCVLGLFGCSSRGQSLIADLPGEQAAAQPATQPTEHANGIVQDWSMHHLVYPRIGEINSLIALQHDPRAILSWQAAEREDFHRVRGPRHFLGQQVHQDWSISLGGGTTAPAMYPAKFTFDVTAAPSCATDFIVYPVNVASSGTQPNIVAFNNLYSGTTPTNGICNRTPSGSDTGVAATTFWSYNIRAAGGVVGTSPALSLDGTKVAFVETGSGTTAHFHVLAGKSGDGVNAGNLQSVTSPVSITSGFSTTTPAAGAVTDLALATGATQSDTLSSPFVDYANDLAYVGNDSGILFRIKNVFCTNAPCTSGGSPAPSLDGTWGSGGGLATACAGQLTGPVVDGGTGNIFVGCSDGKLYGFTPGGVPIAGSPLIVGTGSGTGGIVDPPMVDAVNGFAYVVSGNSAGATQVLVQASTTSFSSPTPVTARLGPASSFNLHAPAFNAAYFSSGFSSVANVQGTTGGTTTTGNTSNWQIYEYSDSGISGQELTLYGVGFNSSHVMTSGAASNFLEIVPSVSGELSPLTEFLNGSTDQLYVGGLINTAPNVVEYNLTDFSGLFPNVLFPINSSGPVGASTGEGSGTTGMVVDNVSSSAQASSIYFGALGPGGVNANSAVKVTQSALQ
jgi:hypothetical protein